MSRALWPLSYVAVLRLLSYTLRQLKIDQSCGERSS
jgi:hypothetical protein